MNFFLKQFPGYFFSNAFAFATSETVGPGLGWLLVRKLGQKPTMIACYMCIVVFSICSFFSKQYLLQATFVLLIRAGACAVTAIVFGLNSQLFPPDYAGRALGNAAMIAPYNMPIMPRPNRTINPD